MNKDVFIKLVWLIRVLHQVVRGREEVTEVRYSSLIHKQSVLSGLKQENMAISSNSLKETFKVKFNTYDNSFQVCSLLFLAFDFCRFCAIIRFFHPCHNGQWPPTSKDFYTRSYPLHYFLILILEKEPVFPFSMLSAKQGNYWYHFYNVFGMTRSLTGDWTQEIPHSKPSFAFKQNMDRQTYRQGDSYILPKLLLVGSLIKLCSIRWYLSMKQSIITLSKLLKNFFTIGQKLVVN